MKTVEQTTRYLSSCVFDDESWGQVLSFCREQYGGGKAHRPKRGRYQTTFADFLAWFKYMPGQGDVVKIGSLIGIIGACTPSEYTLCAYIGQQGRLIQKDMAVFSHHIQPCAPEEVAMFHDKMFHKGVSYSVRLGMLTKLYIPENGEFVSVKHCNTVKHGIFDRTESTNYIFYYIDNDNNDTNVASIPASECEIEATTSKESLDLLERFSHLGIMWSAKDKQFLPVPLKAKLGGTYWYINDKFYVCQAKDTQTPVHKERYKSGNYFTSYGEALVFLKRLKDLRIELRKGLDQ